MGWRLDSGSQLDRGSENWLAGPRESQTSGSPNSWEWPGRGMRFGYHILAGQVHRTQVDPGLPVMEILGSHLGIRAFPERLASSPKPYTALALRILGQTRKTFKCSLDGQKTPPLSRQDFYPLVPILSLNIDGVSQNLWCLRPILAEKLVINKIYGR